MCSRWLPNYHMNLKRFHFHLNSNLFRKFPVCVYWLIFLRILRSPQISLTSGFPKTTGRIFLSQIITVQSSEQVAKKAEKLENRIMLIERVCPDLISCLRVKSSWSGLLSNINDFSTFQIFLDDPHENLFERWVVSCHCYFAGFSAVVDWMNRFDFVTPGDLRSEHFHLVFYLFGRKKTDFWKI